MRLFFVFLLLFFLSHSRTVTALDNGLGLTPPMGFSTWNRFYWGINESLVLSIADAMVSTGLRDAGYTYLNLDAGVWIKERDANGNLQYDSTKFPHGIGYIADYLHNLNLKLGLYTDVGLGSCGTGPGSYGHYIQDANYFASNFSFDYLKVDYCGSNVPLDDQINYWYAFSQALNQTNRSIYFSICPKTTLPTNVNGTAVPYAGQTIYMPPLNWTRIQKNNISNSWLVEYRNNIDRWYDETVCTYVGAPCGMITNIDAVLNYGRINEDTGPGSWMDADMLEVCQFNGTVNTPSLTLSENRIHFYVWAILPSPLILSFDPRTLPNQPNGGQECLNMVKNPEIIRVNQDSLGKGAVLYAQGGGNTTLTITYQILSKVLSTVNTDYTTRYAIVFINRSLNTLELALDFQKLGMPYPNQNCLVRDIGNQNTLGNYTVGISFNVSSHDAVFITVEQ